MGNRAMEITNEMLAIAVKKAVELGLFPKHSDERGYLKYWDGMRQVLAVSPKQPANEEKTPV